MKTQLWKKSDLGFLLSGVGFVVLAPVIWRTFPQIKSFLLEVLAPPQPVAESQIQDQGITEDLDVDQNY